MPFLKDQILIEATKKYAPAMLDVVKKYPEMFKFDADDRRVYVRMLDGNWQMCNNLIPCNYFDYFEYEDEDGEWWGVKCCNFGVFYLTYLEDAPRLGDLIIRS